MRLFLYYVLHAFKNQIRKLLKTWVLLFILICAVVGGLIGFSLGRIMDDDAEVSIEESFEDESTDLAAEEDLSFEDSLLTSSGLSAEALIELAAGALMLVMLLFEAYSSDKSGNKIFLPADVNVLFASPMKPQSVLLFRLATRLGAALLASIYLFIEIPVLTAGLDISFLAGVSLIVTWFLILGISKLLQMLLYTLASTHPGMKKYVRRGVYAVVLLLVAVFIAYQQQSGLSYLPAAANLFNGRFSRWIPVWGWTKGFCLYAIQGSLPLALLLLVLDLAAFATLAYVIWHIRADFYEEALAQTDEMAELLQASQQSQSTGGSIIIKRKKDRSERLTRDRMNRGQGASVFFFKSLYNRFRFAHLGFLTKTAETYLVASIGLSLLARFVLYAESGTSTQGLMLVSLSLAGLSFFRSLGNPLAQDTEMSYFRLIPEPTWKKLFYSLAAGSVNCLLDVGIALVPAVIILGANPLIALAWLLFIVSVDFYATIVGAFIDLSVSVSAGKMVKQFVQILFLYFGLIPDAGLIFIGIRNEQFLPAAICAVLLNLAIGSVFLALTPLFLEPRDKPVRQEAVLSEEDLRLARRRFSRIGLGPFLVFLVSTALQVALSLYLRYASPSWASQTWVTWVFSFAPLYLIAVPIGLTVLRSVPAHPGEKRSLSFRELLVLFPICIFLMYCGSFIGSFVAWLFELILPASGSADPLGSLIRLDSMFWRILVMVILAPIIEEFLFRRQLIDRMRIYGEKRAVFVSALMFGLFHGNFSQMFYAFLLGLVFGYVYLSTGKLRYSIGLHMLINFMGSVIAPEMLDHIDLQTMEVGWPILVYLALLLVLFVLGLVLLCIQSRKVRFASSEAELPRKAESGPSAFRIVYINPGMILFFVGCLAMIITSLL